MTKTKTRRPTTTPDEFEPDYFVGLLESLAEPLDSEPAVPVPRVNKRTRQWGQVMWEDGYRPTHICGHRTHHNGGRKARNRK
jgi:hypothetical protein